MAPELMTPENMNQPPKKRPVIGFGKLTMGGKQKMEAAKTVAASEADMHKTANEELPMIKDAEQLAAEKAKEEEIEKENQEARKAFRAKMEARMEADLAAREADSAHVQEIRKQLGLHDSVNTKAAKRMRFAATGEDASRIQEHADTVEHLRAQAKGVRTLGGELEKPINVSTTGKSETSFKGHEEDRESNPAMFNLAELARQQEAEEQKKNPPRRAA